MSINRPDGEMNKISDEMNWDKTVRTLIKY